MSNRLPLAIAVPFLLGFHALEARAQQFPGAQLSFASSTNPMDMAAADLNGDGKTDFAVAGGLGKTVVVLLSAGSSYAPPATYPLTVASSAIAAGDIDNDGDRDLVVTLQSSGSIGILVNTGGGAFAALTTVLVGTPLTNDPTFLTLGDLNGDACAEAIVVLQNTATIGVALADGLGGFGSFSFLGSGANPQRPNAADIDADGDLDLLVPCAQANSWSLYIGGGNGTLTPAGAVGAGSAPSGVTYLDANLDGNLDAAGSNHNLAFDFIGSVTLRLGDGIGGFPSSSSFSTLQAPNFIASGDLNADGLSDLTTSHGQAGFAIVNALGILNATGPAAFASVKTLAGFNNPGTTSLTDATGDGKTDAAVLNRNGAAVVLVTGDGTGGFQVPIPVAVGGVAISLNIGDLDSDGKADAVVLSAFGIPVQPFKGQGNGTFTVGPTMTLTYAAGGSVLGDFDNDAVLDLVVATNNNSPQIPQGHLAWLKGNGNLTFAPNVLVPSGGAIHFTAAGDLNADGNLDVVTATAPGGQPSVLMTFGGTGTGVPQPAATQNVGLTTRVPVVADLTLDGLLDVVTADLDSFQVSIVAGNGALGLATPVTIPLGVKPQNVTIGDVNHDGAPDIFTANGAAFTVTQLRNLGSTTFALTTIPVLNSAGNVRFADVSGDGYGDLLVGHATAGLGVFRGDALGGLTAAASYFGSAYLLETIDLEGDGRLDVFAAPSIFGSGTAAVYLNASPVPGVSFFGVGTPGCNGILGLTVNSTPNVGNLGFRILGTNAPKRSLGLTIVSDAADFVGSDPFGLGETLYTDFFNSLEVFGLDANTDLAGSAVTVAAIPSIPALVGKTYYAQTSYIEPKGLSCGAALFGLVTTRGLAITIAP